LGPVQKAWQEWRIDRDKAETSRAHASPWGTGSPEKAVIKPESTKTGRPRRLLAARSGLGGLRNWPGWGRVGLFTTVQMWVRDKSVYGAPRGIGLGWGGGKGLQAVGRAD
jgi:hypothetical protein